MSLVDTHSHITAEEFSNDITEILRRAGEHRLSRIMAVGSDVTSSQKAALMAAEDISPLVSASSGIHPHDSSGFSEGLPSVIQELAFSDHVLAIGETGLDYYYNYSERDIQRKVFELHIELAKRSGKPLIVHVRDAFDDALELLNRHSNDGISGVIHSFSGTWNDACSVLDLGFYISFSGMLTFKKSDQLREIASRIPHERILCETDSPYLAPHPVRGKRNEPSFVRYVYRVISDCLDQDQERTEQLIFENSARLFGWE